MVNFGVSATQPQLRCLYDHHALGHATVLVGEKGARGGGADEASGGGLPYRIFVRNLLGSSGTAGGGAGGGAGAKGGGSTGNNNTGGGSPTYRGVEDAMAEHDHTAVHRLAAKRVQLNLKRATHCKVMDDNLLNDVRDKIRMNCKGGGGELLRTFRNFDVDRSGQINMTEFVTVLSRYGMHLPEAQFEMLFAKFDADKSGELDFHEFVTHLMPQDFCENTVMTRSNFEQVRP
jgi:hypothetical protein